MGHVGDGSTDDLRETGVESRPPAPGYGLGPHTDGFGHRPPRTGQLASTPEDGAREGAVAYAGGQRLTDCSPDEGPPRSMQNGGRHPRHRTDATRRCA